MLLHEFPDMHAIQIDILPEVGHAMDEPQRERHRPFDFLRGPEPYRYSWGAVEEPSLARHLFPPGWRDCP
ncbi:hypothetical protein DUT91_14420 [Phyllobacterium salinisoli]|uniref:Uncharacterized protein n=1 Tax=Phyllobacterium salinisoli TaxID=1899321 RepID=A0A368K510_9HYPH|nr:hypothetical protein DUT91_14420 [Phyllobacterium salinisoli]